MEVEPLPTAVTKPFWSTVATSGFLDSQVTPATEAVNWTFSPTRSLFLPSAAVTVIFSCSPEDCCCDCDSPPFPPPLHAAKPKLTSNAKAVNGRINLRFFILKKSFLFYSIEVQRL